MNKESRFLQDIPVKDELHACIVRSPLSKGKLLGIVPPPLPPGYSIITASDIPGVNGIGDDSIDLPLLAFSSVSWYGEPVAMIVGPDILLVETFAQSCKVNIREENPVYTWESFSSDQLIKRFMYKIGSPEISFKNATHLVESVFKTGGQAHLYPEPFAALARFSYDKLEVFVASHWPFHVRETISRVLDVRAEDIIVHTLDSGSHLDGKLIYPSIVASYAALAAVICKKSVRISFNRFEDTQFTPKRPEVAITLRSALNEQGAVLAIDCNATVNMGGNRVFSEEMLKRIVIGALGAYRCSNIHLQAWAVKTDSVPSGVFPGLALDCGSFALEQHVNKIAAAVGLAPDVWRRMHTVQKNESFPGGQILKEDIPIDILLDSVMHMSDYQRKKAAYDLVNASTIPLKEGPIRGIGLSFGFQGNDFLDHEDSFIPASVELVLEKDGSLFIHTSAYSTESETHILWKLQAAEILSLDIDNIHIVSGSTKQVPDSGPSVMSRNITTISTLIERCCIAIQKLRFRNPLPIRVKRSVRNPTTRKRDASRLPGFPLYSWAAVVVELEIDPLFFDVAIRGIWMSVDGGRILDPARAGKALKKACIESLGWIKDERLDLVNGRYDSKQALNYRPALLGNEPPISLDFIWTESELCKGVGELPYNTVPAAFAAAISQACGTAFSILPINSEKIRSNLEDV